MISESRLLYIALPLLEEEELLPVLLACLERQDYRNFHVFACVNQPDEWWDIPGKRSVCEANQRTLQALGQDCGFRLTVIDRCSRGEGWKGSKHGVGWARKTIMDAIDKIADPDDILVSLDADTKFGDHYFSSLVENFSLHPECAAMAIPYYHRLTGNEDADRAILRYEIYMRYYSLNLWRIGSPYSFTALGSAMAFPVWAYRAIGGMTPKMSGEDFYFLQKLRKFGRMIFTNPEKVYPAARFSDRVYFGTGPAMIRGNQGDWASYPVYSMDHFDDIRMTTALFPDFFRQTTFTPVVQFLSDLLREEDPFHLLRKNFKEVSTFVRACHEKFDGLRILQYLKFRQKNEPVRDEEHLRGFLEKYYPDETDEILPDAGDFSFATSSIEFLDRIRNFLVNKEEGYQLNSVPSLPGQLPPAA